MLQVKDLCVEIGGKLVVNGASFAVMPRDKVGLVGRNGAGKTSLFKVLGGATEPKSGVINRKGGFGYLPQDPRIAGAFDARTAVAHILSGRGIDEDIVHMEKLRIAMEETASDSNVAKFAKAEESFALKGGYASDSEARAIAAGLGIKADRLNLALGVLSGASVVVLNLREFYSVAAIRCCWMNRQTTWTSTQKLGCSIFFAHIKVHYS